MDHQPAGCEEAPRQDRLTAPVAPEREGEMEDDSSQMLEDARLTAIGNALHQAASETGEWVAFHEWPCKSPSPPAPCGEEG